MEAEHNEKHLGRELSADERGLEESTTQIAE